jgi:ADP-ribosyl-[dinitrogen reductase] hydrolase
MAMTGHSFDHPLQDRALGTMLGLACGDALGAAVEFAPRGSFLPVTGMRGGGPHGIPPGFWTDDTSMALALAHSLATCGGFDAQHQMEAYCAWWKEGQFSSTGDCFDIGIQTRSALERFLRTGNPLAGSTAAAHAGNGSLMRLAPVVIFYVRSAADTVMYAAESSRTTHGTAACVDACRAFALLLHHALHGADKATVLASADPLLPLLADDIALILRGSYREKPQPRISSSGYVVHTLEAALWCFHHTDSLEEAVLLAANLGEDADTVAAVTGQLAGAFYGASAIPAPWLETLHAREQLEAAVHDLLAASKPL